MYVIKCDLCKKQIKGKPVVAGIEFNRMELCEKCGRPVLRFLKNKKLVKQKDDKIIWPSIKKTLKR